MVFLLQMLCVSFVKHLRYKLDDCLRIKQKKFKNVYIFTIFLMDKATLLEEFKRLEWGASTISKETGIPDSRIRMWYHKNVLPKQEDYQKLLELWDRIKKNPTYDFYWSEKVGNSVVNEADHDYSDKEYLFNRILELEKRVEEQSNYIKLLEEVNANLKTPVVSVQKTKNAGGQTSSK